MLFGLTVKQDGILIMCMSHDFCFFIQICAFYPYFKTMLFCPVGVNCIKKSHDTHTVKILSDLTLKPDGIAIENFKNLRETHRKFLNFYTQIKNE
jgi:hypothetical protein